MSPKKTRNAFWYPYLSLNPGDEIGGYKMRFKLVHYRAGTKHILTWGKRGRIFGKGPGKYKIVTVDVGKGELVETHKNTIAGVRKYVSLVLSTEVNSIKLNNE